MAVKIRLAKRGRKKLAIFDIVVTDSRSPRDSKFIEKIGTYNPNTNPAAVVLNEEKAFDWVMKGAQPTDTARTILAKVGLMYKKHLQIGVQKGAITQDVADKKLDEWKKQKEAAVSNEKGNLEKSKAAAKKAKLEAEAKVSAARAEEIKKKKIVAEAEAQAAAAPAPAETAPAAEAASEAPAAEAENAEAKAE